jgi:hypothetical protein
MMLHALKIDEIKVKNIIRLGKRLPTEATTNIMDSRPIKVVVENEKQKWNAKKLGGHCGRRFVQSIHPYRPNTKASGLKKFTSEGIQGKTTEIEKLEIVKAK